MDFHRSDFQSVWITRSNILRETEIPGLITRGGYLTCSVLSMAYRALFMFIISVPQ